MADLGGADVAPTAGDDSVRAGAVASVLRLDRVRLPSCRELFWIAALTKAGEHEDAIPGQAINQLIWKPAKEHATALTIDSRERFRRAGDNRECGINCACELGAQSARLTLVPVACSENIDTRFGEETKPRHYLSLSNNSRRTASQATLEPGSRW